MNSLILCEGKTDCILLQYYLEKVHSWDRKGKSSFHAVDKAWSNYFEKDGNTLIISETGGCSRISEGLLTAINRNKMAAPVATCQGLFNQNHLFFRPIFS